MNRFLLRRRSDKLYLRQGRTIGRYRSISDWVAEMDKARVFTNRGHAVNAAAPHPDERQFTTRHVHDESCPHGRPCYQYGMFDKKGWRLKRRQMFEELYEVVTISFKEQP